MDKECIEESLDELHKKGLLKHEGMKDGLDSFSVSKDGEEYAENLIATNPDHTMIIIKLLYADMDADNFYKELFKLIDNIREHRKK